jgi:inositol oxygenase
MIRYHSFYPQHRHNAYDHLMTDHDHEMFKWVDKFNKYDLYSKIDVRSDSKTLRPYYEKLVEKFLPKVLKF